MDEPKKSLGQHWLHDGETLDAIVGEAHLVPTDTVVEIGPGLGTLTEKLLATGAKVVAVEFDEVLLPALRARFADEPRFTLVHADILKYDFSKLPTGYKIVANIPYYLTSHLLRILTDSVTPPQCAVLLVQKEVAERVAAKPGDMGILTVIAQLEFAVSLGTVVPAALFTPPPKVDSQVLILQKRDSELFRGLRRKEFIRLVKAGFSAKRKTLRNTISAGLQISKPAAEALLAGANIDPGRRAETLSLAEWYELHKNLTS